MSESKNIHDSESETENEAFDSFSKQVTDENLQPVLLSFISLALISSTHHNLKELSNIFQRFEGVHDEDTKPHYVLSDALQDAGHEPIFTVKVPKDLTVYTYEGLAKLMNEG